MLSDRERQVLDELERSYDLDRPRSPARRSWRSPVTAGTVAWAAPLCLFLLLSGAATGALALAAAVALGWSLWRFWVELGRGFSVAAASATEDGETTGGSLRGPVH